MQVQLVYNLHTSLFGRDEYTTEVDRIFTDTHVTAVTKHYCIISGRIRAGCDAYITLQTWVELGLILDFTMGVE